MAGVAPQALVHDLALVGRIGLELRELEVAHGLEVDADGEDDDPHDLDRPEGVRQIGDGGDLHRQADQPHEDALEAEHQPQALDGEGVAPSLAHGDVAGVLTLPVVADEEVHRQASTPEGHHAGQQEPPALGPVADRVGHPGHEHEARPPDDVDDRHVLQRERHQPGADHEHGDGHGTCAEDLEVAHGVRSRWLCRLATPASVSFIPAPSPRRTGPATGRRSSRPSPATCRRARPSGPPRPRARHRVRSATP